MDSKVIGIGFHKTGTTSLGEALTMLGYRNFHGAGVVRNELGNQQMMELLHKNDLEPILEIAKKADALQDNPWFLIYQALDEHFPGSKFILTIRKDKKWIKSALRYFKGESDFRHWIYGKGNPRGNESVYLERYRRHNQQVKVYFKERPDDLLILDFEEGDGWEKLCRFLKKPVPEERFPHLNNTKVSFLRRIMRYVVNRTN